MERRVLSLLLALGLASAASWSATAETARGNLYRAGGSLEVDAPVSGDLHAAAGRLLVSQPIAQDATLAAGDIEVRAPIGQDLRAAAGRLRVAAAVKGEARLAGGDVRLEPEAEIAGPLWVAGGHVELLGRSGDRVTAHAGELVIGGEVQGDLQATTGQLRLLPGARVHGRLRYASEREAEVAPGALVSGGIEREAPRQHPDRPPQTPGAAGAVVWVAGLFAAGVLWWLLFPNFARSAQVQLQRAPGPSLAWGAAALLGVPLLALLLMITIIGLPLALALMAAYALMLLAGYLVVAGTLAERLLQARGIQPAAALSWKSRLGALALALLLLVLVALLPVVGWLLALGALMAGTGALVRLRLAARTPAPAQPA